MLVAVKFVVENEFINEAIWLVNEKKLSED